MKWYVIKVSNNKEKKLKETIEIELKRNNNDDIISNLLVPSKKIEQKRNGKKINVEKVTFPGYIFVECENIKQLEGYIKNISGINSILKTPLSDSEVDRLLDRIKINDTIIITDNFTISEKVKITEGPFKNFIGTIISIDDTKKRAKLVVNIFERETPLELTFDQISKDL